LAPLDSHALDVVTSFEESTTDQRNAYPLALLSMALEKTEKDFGPYQLKKQFRMSSRDRGLLELEKGEIVNVLTVPTRPEWEQKALPIRISIHKDLLDYRVLLIDRTKQSMFSEIHTYEDLKQLRFGLMPQWTTTLILKDLGFKIVDSAYYEGLFGMLMRGRFDAFIRGLSEVYQELSIHKNEFPNLMIEPNLALHLPMPVYFFVSPKNPRLHRRIETGLRRMQADGSFEVLFDAYHEAKAKDDLKNRRIIYIPNPYSKGPLANQ